MNRDLLTKLANLNQTPAELRREFLKFYSELTLPQRNKPIISNIQNSLEFLKQIYDFSDGIIFGEEHFDNISAGFLIDHIEYLADLGVKTFFFEGLFYGLERGMDGRRDERDNVHEEYRKLIDTVKQHNIKIVGI